MLGAAHPRRVGLHKRPHHPEVQGAPAASALTLVIPGAAALAHPAAAPTASGGPHHGDDRVAVLVVQDLLDHGVLDTQQPLP